MTKDTIYMRRALELAERGRGLVSPNPMVGCVIVHNDVIIGEGWHQRYGGAHAEPNAIHSVADKSLLSESTIYITLEPCVHYGKTPPCVDLIIMYMPERVVICNLDPNPLVAGQGIARLKEMDIQVTTGVLEDLGRELNKRFFTFHEKKRPYIILKWAQTADGYIARENFDSKWISDEDARRLTHHWRSEEDGILVGTKTVLHDNPMLTVRMADGANPMRFYLDKECIVPRSFHIQDGSVPTVCYNAYLNKQDGQMTKVKLDYKYDIIPQIIADMHSRSITSLIVEGGATLLQSFLSKGLWDEARVFTSQIEFRNGILAPKILDDPYQTNTLFSDVLRWYKNHKS